MLYRTPIYIYFHICTIGSWEQVVKKLYDLICISKLIDRVNEIRIVVLGNELDKVKHILNHPKISIVYHSFDKTSYERKCLLLLREHAEQEHAYFLYIHSKGITKSNNLAIQDWVNLLAYYTIVEYEHCITELANFDTVGVNLVFVHSAHYSGNFWWANSNYIRKLPKTIGPKYVDPELWIGLGESKKMLSLWQSGVNHYKVRYPDHNYIGNFQHHIHQIQ